MSLLICAKHSKDFLLYTFSDIIQLLFLLHFANFYLEFCYMLYYYCYFLFLSIYMIYFCHLKNLVSTSVPFTFWSFSIKDKKNSFNLSVFTLIEPLNLFTLIMMIDIILTFYVVRDFPFCFCFLSTCCLLHRLHLIFFPLEIGEHTQKAWFSKF